MEDYNSYLLLSYTFVLSAKYISSTLSNHCTPIPYFTLCANRTILKYPYLLNKVQLECSSTRPLSLKARQPSRHGTRGQKVRHLSGSLSDLIHHCFLSSRSYMEIYQIRFLNILSLSKQNMIEHITQNLFII